MKLWSRYLDEYYPGDDGRVPPSCEDAVRAMLAAHRARFRTRRTLSSRRNDINNKVRVFIAHGEEDAASPFEGAVRLAEAAAGRTAFTFFAPGRDHNDLPADPGFAAFLRRAVR